MTGLAGERVAVVVAAIDARRTVQASLARFLDEARGCGEVVLVDASRDGTAAEAERLFSDLRVVRRPAGRLVPELWRDGIRSTSAPLVALSTAAMVPSHGWLKALIDRMEQTRASVVGGTIAPSSHLSALDRAVYLHRYLNYLRPQQDSPIADPPGDNALYRRQRLVGLETLWEQGFWEVAVNRQLRERGDELAMAPRAVVAFHGGGHRSTILRHRFAHARWYAAQRSRDWSTAERLARLGIAPALPVVLLTRVLRGLARRGEHLGFWLPALPHLALLLAAWSLGEASGLLLQREPVAVPQPGREDAPAVLQETRAVDCPGIAGESSQTLVNWVPVHPSNLFFGSQDAAGIAASV